MISSILGKFCAIPLLVSPILLPFLAAPVFAQPQGLPNAVHSAKVDLNGDGTPEKISVSSNKANLPRAILSVNGVTFTETEESFDSDDAPGFSLVKIDGKSKARQIAIEFMSPNGLSRTVFYRWDGSAIRRIGSVENVEKVPGDGKVYGGIYMDFWTCKQQHIWNPKTQTLSLVRQSTYPLAIPATVKESFSLQQTHTDGSSTVTKLAPGTKIQLTQFWSPTAEPGDSVPTNSWFRIKTSTGVSGWTRLDTFKEKVDGLIYSG